MSRRTHVKDPPQSRVNMTLDNERLREITGWLEKTYGRRDVGLYRWRRSGHQTQGWDIYKSRVMEDRILPASGNWWTPMSTVWRWQVRMIFSDPGMAVHMKLTWG